MLTCNFKSFKKSSENSFCQNYIFSHRDKPHLGTLFLILQIDSEKSIAQKISEILSEIINHEYFRKDNDILKNFEFALSRVNQAMATLAEEGHTEWLNRFHALTAVIYNDQIHFTTTGKAFACLWRNNEIINITEELKSEKSFSVMKTFVNIISGNLKENDKLLFATPHFLDYFSWEKIKWVFQKSTIDQIQKDFISDLSETSESMNFIIVEIKEKTSKESSFQPQPSLAIKTNTLSPPHSPTLPSKFLPSKIDWEKNLIEIKETINKILKKFKNTFESFFNFVTSFKKQKTSFFTLSSPTNKIFTPNIIFAKLKNFFKEKYLKIKEKISLLPPLSRTLLYVALLFIFALIVNITRTSLKQKEKRLNLQEKNALVQAQEKEKQASDALIYNDYKKAEKLLFEAKEIVEKNILPSKKYKNEGEKLLSQIQADFDKVNKVIRVKEFKSQISLEEEKIEAPSIISVNNVLFLFDTKANTLYKFDDKTKKLLFLAKNDDLKNVILVSPNETKNTILFLTKKFDLYEFIVETKNFQTLEIAFAEKNTLPQDMQSYTERLYFLFPSQNQILRYQRTISGYAGGSEWFSDKTNLNIKDAVSFAIDGSVYILKAKGEILKFLNAKQEEFKMPSLVPPLSQPTKIYTSTDNELLYVLEPKEKRIIVLDKKGGLKNQFFADEFSEAKEISVNEKEKKIYILTTKKLLELSFEK